MPRSTDKTLAAPLSIVAIFGANLNAGASILSSAFGRVVQIEQDLAVCAHKFPSLICRSIAAQFMADGVIALFELEEGEDGPAICAEKHYKLVPPDEITESDLQKYREHGQGLFICPTISRGL